MIRFVQKEELEQINNLSKQLDSSVNGFNNLEEELNKDITILLVDIENKEIRGYLYAQNLIDHVDLLSIVVDYKYRKNNIGTNLMNYLINNYCYHKDIFLEVAIDNIPAISLYTKLGFKVVNIRKNYYNNKDAFLMKRGEL